MGPARSLIPVAFISRWILAHSVSRATHARMKSVSRQPRPAWAMPLSQHLDAGRYRNLLTALGGVVACTSTSSTSSAGPLRYTLLGLHSLSRTHVFTSVFSSTTLSTTHIGWPNMAPLNPRHSSMEMPENGYMVYHWGYGN